ncbi:nitroreductase family protein, partial [Alistipes ihumii]
DYTKTCDWILVYVADYSKMAGGSDSDRAVTAGIDAGLIAQNVYLYGASEGLAVVVHMSINRDVIARALKLGASQHIVLAQSVGLPASR